MSIYVYVLVCGHVPVSADVCGGQRHQIPFSGVQEVERYPVWVLATKLGSSVGARSSLNR